MGDTKATAENGSEQRAKELIAQWMLGGPSLEGLEAKVAGALAACALEARLEEAKWWLEKAGRDGHFWIVSPIHKHPEDCRCEAHGRITALERAAEDKA